MESKYEKKVVIIKDLDTKPKISRGLTYINETYYFLLLHGFSIKICKTLSGNCYHFSINNTTKCGIINKNGLFYIYPKFNYKYIDKEYRRDYSSSRFCHTCKYFLYETFSNYCKKNNIEYIFHVNSYESINWISTSIQIKTPYRCMALTKNKKYCKNKALCNSQFCKQHHNMIESSLDALMINNNIMDILLKKNDSYRSKNIN